jgi:hypothetical protein
MNIKINKIINLMKRKFYGINKNPYKKQKKEIKKDINMKKSCIIHKNKSICDIYECTGIYEMKIKSDKCEYII